LPEFRDPVACPGFAFVTVQTATALVHEPQPSGDVSISTSLEHLVASSQSILSKRIELALLEGKEVLSRSIAGAALAGAGVLLSTACYLAMAGALVLLLIPAAEPVLRLFVFGLASGSGALGCGMLAMRHSRRAAPRTKARPADASFERNH
jgi:hypothetical protein